MYLPNPDVGPTGAEPVEFLDLSDLALRSPGELTSPSAVAEPPRERRFEEVE